MRDTRYTCECGQSVHTARRLHHESKHRREAMRRFGPVNKGDLLYYTAGNLPVVVVTLSDEAMRVRLEYDEEATPFRVLPHEVVRLA